MSKFQSARLALIALLILSPCLCWAQAADKELQPRTSSTGASYILSVREVRVPSKARKAFEKGVDRLAKNDPSGSLVQFQRAIARFPEYYEAYYASGLAELRLERDEDAERAFQKSIDLSAGHYAPPQVALGSILCDHGEFAAAESPIRRGLELDPNSWVARLYLARALFGQQRWDEAAESAQELILLNPQVREAYLVLAGVHFHQNKEMAALNDLDEYLKFDHHSELSAKIRNTRDQLARADLR
jgi:tetratricopeptide (TPR) repeat protein